MGQSFSIGLSLGITRGCGGQNDPLRPILVTGPVLAPVGPNDIGEQIFATSGTWLNSPTFAWTWYRDGVLIVGANADSYDLVEADGGTIITARLVATNAYGSNSAGTNASYAGTVPIVSVAPEVTGDSNVGSILSCSTGTWTMNALTYDYQWHRDGASILGQTNSTYQTDSVDIGFDISCEVIARNSWGSSDPSESNAITVVDVQIPVLPVYVVSPAISGTPTVGQTLSVTSGTWTGYPAPTFTYQWYADSIPIAGATSTTYLLTADEAGKYISAFIIATNSVGSVGANSNVTALVSGGGIALLSAATVAEDAAVGATVGTLSVSGATGTPTWSLDNDGDGHFVLDGDDLNIATDLDYEVQTSHMVVVSASGTTPLIPQTTFTITVTDVDDFPVNTAAPEITGTVEVGELLTASDGTWTGTPTPVLTYQWLADDVEIDGATASTYFLTPTETGAVITVTVTATNTAGVESETSAGTVPVVDFVAALKFNDKRNSQYAFLGWHV